MARRRPIVSYLWIPEGHDVDTQRQANDAFAQANGFLVVEEIVDKSIAPRSRARFRTAVDLARQENCPLLVSGFDWLSRHADVVDEFAAQDVPVIVAGETPIVVRPYREWNERKRQRHGRNIKKALADRKAKGVRLGNPKNLASAGSTGREAQVVRAEAYAVKVFPIIEEIRRGGVTSISGIAGELNRRGVGAPRGGQWAAITVRRILERMAGG